MKPRIVFLLLLSLLGLAALGATMARRTHGDRGPATPAGPSAQTTSPRIVAEGRLVTYPGAEVHIGTELAGLILHLPVEENKVVEQGALIAELKADDLRAALQEAQARVAELDAEEAFALSETSRRHQLSANGAISRQERESSERDLAVVRARRTSALASIARIEADLAKTRIAAPFRATVVRRYVSAHEIVNAHAPLVTLADLDRVRVEAEVDEFDAGRLRPGARALVTAEGYPGQSWPGRVEEIPPMVVGKGLEPRDPSRPIDVRVLRAKIALDGPTPLKLGQRVEVEISSPPREQAS